MSNNRRLLLLLPFLLAAAWLALFGDKTPSDQAAVVTPPVAAMATTAESAPGAPIADEPVEAQTDNMPAEGDAETQVHRLRGRASLSLLDKEAKVDLFSLRGGDPNPPPPVVEAPPAPVVPQQPFVVIGRMFDRDHWLVFFEREGKTYAAQAGDVVDGFRVDVLTGQEARLTQLVDKSKFVIPMDGEKKDLAHD